MTATAPIVATAAPPPPCPYKGLVPFDEDDWPLFFGRKAETEIVVGNLLAARLTVLYGSSGVGKSSLLRAGVVHQTREKARQRLAAGEPPDALVVYFAAWRDDPLPALIRAIGAAADELVGAGPSKVPPRFLADAIADASRRTGADILLLLDQFEEYFTYHPDEKGEGTFATEFTGAVRASELRASFLLSLREDALALLDRFKVSLPQLLANRLRVDHLDKKGARAAILGPVEYYNQHRIPEHPAVKVEDPDLVDAVIEDVRVDRVLLAENRGSAKTLPDASSAPQFEAPFLQLVMTRLWRDEAAQGVLRAKAFKDLGGAEEIVRQHLREALDALTSDEKAAAAKIFRFLLTPSGMKVAHTVRDLAEYAELPAEQVEAVLTKLSGDRRILRAVATPASETAGPKRFEIFHDVLARSIRDWRTSWEREENARKFEQEQKRGKEELAWAHRRAYRRLGLVSAAFLAFLTTVAILWLRAAHEHILANQRAIAAIAMSKIDVDPELALLLAQHAMATKVWGQRPPEVADTLRRALAANRVASPAIEFPSRVLYARFCGKGDLLVVLNEGGLASLWDLRAPRAPLAKRDGMTGAAWGASDDCVLAVGSEHGQWTAVDLLKNQVVHGAIPLGEPITAIAFSADARILATGGSKGAIQTWEATTGKPIRPMSRGTQTTWETSTRKSIPSMSHGTFVKALAFGAQPTLLASAGLGGEVRIWDLLSDHDRPQVLQTEDHLWNDTLFDIAISPDGHWVAAGGWKRSVTLWDRKNGSRYTLAGHHNTVFGVAFAPNSRVFATCSADGMIKIWDALTRRELFTLAGHSNAVNEIAFRRDGRLLASAGWDRTVKFWDLSGHAAPITGIAFSSNGQSLASAGADGVVKLWNPQSGEEIRTLYSESNELIDVSLSESGKRITATGRDGWVTVWDTAVGRDFRSKPPSSHEIVGTTIAPDGKSVVAAAADGFVYAWDDLAADVWRPGRVFAQEQQSAAAFTPKGDFLAVVSEWGGLALLKWPSLERIRPRDIKTHDQNVSGLAMAPTGKTFATASLDGTAKLWDLGTMQLLPQTPLRHAEAVRDVSFSASGLLLATASWDRTAAVWETGTGKRILAIGHAGPVEHVALSPDGSIVATVTDTDTRPQLHRREEAALLALANQKMIRSLTESECQEYLKHSCR